MIWAWVSWASVSLASRTTERTRTRTESGEKEPLLSCGDLGDMALMEVVGRGRGTWVGGWEMSLDAGKKRV